MLTPEVEKRITLTEVLNSTWLQNGPVATAEEIHTEMCKSRPEAFILKQKVFQRNVES